MFCKKGGGKDVLSVAYRANQIRRQVLLRVTD